MWDVNVIFLVYIFTFSCNLTDSTSQKGLSHIFNIRMNVKYFKTSGDTSWIRLQLRKTYRNFFIYLRHTGIAFKWLLFKFKCIKFFNALKVSGRANKRLFSNVSQRNLTKRSIPAGRTSRKFPLNPNQKKNIVLMSRLSETIHLMFRDVRNFLFLRAMYKDLYYYTIMSPIV